MRDSVLNPGVVVRKHHGSPASAWILGGVWMPAGSWLAVSCRATTPMHVRMRRTRFLLGLAIR
jgi:hypothetical protein